jgi:uncharacterized glyoxalase superfamily protein PhnB
VDAAVWGFVGVVIGGIVAGYFGNRSERIRHEAEARLDRDRRQDDRRLALEKFQREALVALQDAANDLARAAMQIHLHDVQELRKSSRSGGTPVGDEVSTAAMNAARRVMTLRTRIADASARASAEHLTTAYSLLVDSKDEATGDAALVQITEAGVATITRCGELIVGTFRLD